MHTTRCRHITRRLNEQGKWEETIESEYYLSEPDKGDKLYRIKDGMRQPVTVTRAKTRSNFSRSRQDMLQQDFDEQGRLIHRVLKGENYMEETVIVFDQDYSIAHSLKHYNDLFKEDEYTVMISDSNFCIENTYSYDTGRRLSTQVISVSEGYCLDIDYLPEGTICEWQKQRLE